MILYNIFPKLFPSVIVPLRHITRFRGENVRMKGELDAVISVPESFLNILPESYRYSYVFDPKITFYFPSRKEARNFQQKTGM